MSNPIVGVPQMSALRTAVLVELIEKLAVEFNQIRILEVGSYEGISALVMSEAVARIAREGGSVLCVDPWVRYLKHEHSELATRMNNELESGQVFERFLQNSKLAPEKAPISHLRSTLKETHESFGQFEMVVIDGDHTFDACFSDIMYAVERVRRGGILCGDDLERELPDVALHQRDDEREYNGTFHPGVTKAVWMAFGRRVWVKNSVWAARRGRTAGESFSFEI